jgi:ornithine carbamoyltransferase
MADIFTISEKFDSLDGITISYVGDGNNIVHSWLELASILPINFNIVCPENFLPDMDLVEKTKNKNISSIKIFHDPHDGVLDADVIYTDVWASMGQKEEAENRRKIFEPFQVNDALMNASGKDTIFMHCLPAERGVEVTDSVCDSPNSVIFDQAENRMHAQNAIMLDLMKV